MHHLPIWPTLHLTKRLKHLLVACIALLDHLDDLLELSNPRIAHTLIQPTLARAHDGTLVSQARERNGNFFFVAAADAVGDDVDAVAVAEQIEGGLGDADVRFDADDDAGEGRGELCEGGANLRGSMLRSVSLGVWRQLWVWRHTAWRRASCHRGPRCGCRPAGRALALDMSRRDGLCSGWWRRRGC